MRFRWSHNKSTYAIVSFLFAAQPVNAPTKTMPIATATPMLVYSTVSVTANLYLRGEFGHLVPAWTISPLGHVCIPLPGTLGQGDPAWMPSGQIVLLMS
jgi:hypothetical protein